MTPQWYLLDARCDSEVILRVVGSAESGIESNAQVYRSTMAQARCSRVACHCSCSACAQGCHGWSMARPNCRASSVRRCRGCGAGGSESWMRPAAKLKERTFIARLSNVEFARTPPRCGAFQLPDRAGHGLSCGAQAYYPIRAPAWLPACGHRRAPALSYKPRGLLLTVKRRRAENNRCQ